VAAATIRRRRFAVVGMAAVVAAVAFVFRSALGGGSGPAADAANQFSPQQLAGERIVVGFDGAEAPPLVRRMIRVGGVAGVILFADNFPSRTSGRRLIRGLQGIPRPPGLRDPLLIVTDQEGGLVKRLGGAPTASAAEMVAGGATFSRAQGRRTAVNLRNVGVNVDLAPVLDIARRGGTIAEARRAFGSTAEAVDASAIPFSEAMQRAGVAATAKHFPGFGAAASNTDFAVQRIDLPRSVLRGVDEAPYRGFTASGGELVMLSTAIYPAFSPLPAAFSRPIATGELRSRLGFEGVSITDALDSVAVRDFGGPAKAGTAAARAGVDLLLFTDPAAAGSARRALLRRLRSGALDEAAFEASADRVLRLRHELAGS
jgi:beta-N-acetylhexosaminidase